MAVSKKLMIDFLVTWRTQHQGSRSDSNLRRELQELTSKTLQERIDKIRDNYASRGELAAFNEEWNEYTGRSTAGRGNKEHGE